MSEDNWTFLSNHGHVLVALSRDSEVRLRDVAAQVGITERSAQGILRDLVAGGYVRRERVGRRNRYEIEERLPLRHPLERGHRVGELVSLGSAESPPTPTR